MPEPSSITVLPSPASDRGQLILTKADALLREHTARYPPVSAEPLPVPDDLAQALTEGRPPEPLPARTETSLGMTWVVVVTVPLSAFLTSVLTALGHGLLNGQASADAVGDVIEDIIDFVAGQGEDSDGIEDVSS